MTTADWELVISLCSFAVSSDASFGTSSST